MYCTYLHIARSYGKETLVKVHRQNLDPSLYEGLARRALTCSRASCPLPVAALASLHLAQSLSITSYHIYMVSQPKEDGPLEPAPVSTGGTYSLHVRLLRRPDSTGR
jgi:hypothetical protein